MNLEQIKDIVKGTTNVVLGNHQDLSLERLKICDTCGICTMTNRGPFCSNKLWIEPETEKISRYPQDGYVRGCGCYLAAKTTLKDNHCVIGKW